MNSSWEYRLNPYVLKLAASPHAGPAHCARGSLGEECDNLALNLCVGKTLETAARSRLVAERVRDGTQRPSVLQAAPW